MTHRRFTHYFRRKAPTARALAAVVACSIPRLLHAQASPPVVTPSIPAYRTPVIALVQPIDGGTVPQDKPVIVFRIAQGEPDDPIDMRSLLVARDGVDVTAAFQLTGLEAWGSMAGSLSSDPLLGAGSHQLVARICSARGACGTANAAVSIVVAREPALVSGETSTKHGRIMDLLIRATKKLLLP